MFLRKLSVNLVIISLVFTLACPIVGTRFSYAENSPEGWEQVTNTSDLVDAFRYYCKSRDVTIEGSVADAVTSFTTDVFNGLCVATGINLSVLQAELSKQIDSSSGAVSYLFTQTGVTAYNRLFQQFLQDNELEVGDTNVNKQIYSGVWVTDADNNGCYASVFNNNFSPSNLVSLGTPYKYGVGQNFKILYDSGIRSLGFHFIDDNNKTQYIQEYIGTDPDYQGFIYDSSGSAWRPLYSPDNSRYGYYNITASPLSSGGYSFYLTVHTFINGSLSDVNNRGQVRVGTLSDPNYHETSVNIVAPIINNNNYEGDTIINNNGDVINNNPDTDDDNWDYPDIPSSDSYPGQPGSGINWPSLDLPNIDLDSPGTWSLGNITEKFPFSIPFDLVALLTVLNHEPVTPDFTSDIQIGSICNWHIDADLEQFDGIATLIRTFEFIGFCIGLLYFTVHIVKG